MRHIGFIPPTGLRIWKRCRPHGEFPGLCSSRKIGLSRQFLYRTNLATALTWTVITFLKMGRERIRHERLSGWNLDESFINRAHVRLQLVPTSAAHLVSKTSSKQHVTPSLPTQPTAIFSVLLLKTLFAWLQESEHADVPHLTGPRLWGSQVQEDTEPQNWSSRV